MTIFTPQPFTSPLISFSARPISPPLSLNQSISSSSIPSSLLHSSTNPTFSKSLKLTPLRASTQQQIYTYPDPIPEFAEAETQKFSCELLKKFYKNKDPFGNDLDEVVKVCAEIFREFLHKEYGGPGTLLVEPFTDMLVAIKEKELPGAPVAARAALLWAQNYLDKDWDTWTSQPPQ